MADPVFADGVTPLNAVNLNKLQTRDEKAAVNGYASLDGTGKVPAAQVPAALPADTVVAAATRIIANLRAGGDTQPSFRFFGDGKHEWGPGGATAPDTNLYRSAAGQLTTDGVFSVRGTDIEVKNAAGTELRAMLHRDFTGTDQPALALYAPAGAEKVRLGIAAGPGSTPGVILGGDTNLYRSAAGSLKTDGHLNVGGFLFAGWDQTAGNGGMALRQSGDTNYRLFVSNNGTLSWGNGTAGVDTNLYRSGAGTLRTDGVFFAGGQVGVDIAGTGARLTFGSGGDTYLYRSGVNTLRTDGVLFINGHYANVTGMTGLYMDFYGVGQKAVEVGAGDSGGAGYRMLRVSN